MICLCRELILAVSVKRHNTVIFGASPFALGVIVNHLACRILHYHSPIFIVHI